MHTRQIVGVVRARGRQTSERVLPVSAAEPAPLTYCAPGSIVDLFIRLPPPKCDEGPEDRYCWCILVPYQAAIV
jgi:hypothetical protein